MRRRIGLFETPAPERDADLKLSARSDYCRRRYTPRARYLQALARSTNLLDDQFKLNHPVASEFLSPAGRDGWNACSVSTSRSLAVRNRECDDVREAQGYAVAAHTHAPAEAWRWHGLSLMKAGRQAEARLALSRYLTMQPGAADAPFIRQMIG